MHKLGLVALVVVAWVAFSLSALVSILVCPVAVLTKRYRYASNVLHAMDCLMAAVLGYDGRHTVSAECGADRTGLCKTLCAFLDLMDKGHCARSAK